MTALAALGESFILRMSCDTPGLFALNLKHVGTIPKY